jgi:hypothetical protein
MRLIKNLVIYVAATIGMLLILALPDLLGALIHWLGLDWLFVIGFFAAMIYGLHRGLNYLIDEYYENKR